MKEVKKLNQSLYKQILLKLFLSQLRAKQNEVKKVGPGQKDPGQSRISKPGRFLTYMLIQFYKRYIN